MTIVAAEATYYYYEGGGGGVNCVGRETLVEIIECVSLGLMSNYLRISVNESFPIKMFLSWPVQFQIGNRRKDKKKELNKRREMKRRWKIFKR